MSPRRSIIPLFIPHLGCPNNCVFCNQHRISGSLQPVGPEDVTNELIKALSVPADGERELAFYGGSFTAIPFEEQRALLAAAQPFLKRGEITSIRLSTRPDCINEEVLVLLKDSGVKTVELGVQSLCDNVLFLSGRGHSAADAENAVSLLRAEGFGIILQMMTGLPGADEEADMETARKITALKPDGVRIYPTVIIKDTPLYDAFMKGEYKEHTVEAAVSLCARILPMFEEAEIPVIRLGLNPTDDLSGGDAAAGAYHPALGELVRARIFRERAMEMLSCGNTEGREIRLKVSPKNVSKMTGQKRENIIFIREKTGASAVKVKADDGLSGDEIRTEII